jgi:hypothetical protein
VAVRQPITVTGTNWQAGAFIVIGVGHPGRGVEEWVATVTGDGNRSFTATFMLGSHWQNAGQVVLTAQIPNGKSATTTFWVTGSTQ